MTRFLIFLTALIGMGFLSANAFAQRGRGRGNPAARNGWLFDYRSAKAQAKKTGKPIMVVIRCVP